MKMEKELCRVWWPKQLLESKPDSNLLLFGWCFHSFNSVDIILAHATTDHEISTNNFELNLQEILKYVDIKMPRALQEFSAFTALGTCILQDSTQSSRKMTNTYNDDSSINTMGIVNCLEEEDLAVLSSDIMSCRCVKLCSFINNERQAAIRCGNWIQMFSRSLENSCRDDEWIPEFDHIHQNGDVLSIEDFHLILYNLPAYNRHHYTLNSMGYLKNETTPFSYPRYMNHHLHKKQPFANLELVVSALNCSNAAKQLLQGCLLANVSPTHLLCWLESKLWNIFAISLASLSTVVYVILRLFHIVLNDNLHMLAILILKKSFSHTWKNAHIRCCQFIYWPIFLLGSGFSSHTNAGYADRDTIRKHSMWTSVAVDILLGAFCGLAILTNVELISCWISSIAQSFTDNLLRLGCVWLMGVPAGFKLNTELAELFGMASLDAIQIFSTLWLFMSFVLRHFIRTLALAGILFGFTLFGALLVDMLKIATLHVAALHWLISFVYSQQIQALASLWRLFRGQKWNPLRQRLDSYESYSVEQHVVGSLLFTPLLLLLPTTSIFYVFFTLVSTSFCLMCFTIEMTNSVLHSTPYAEIILWLVRQRRFPSGIWFDIVSFSSYEVPQIAIVTSNSSVKGRKGIALSILHSKFATLGQIVWPSYVKICGEVSTTLSSQLASEILRGRSIRPNLDTCLPPPLPWLHISFRDYWRLCYCSIIG